MITLGHRDGELMHLAICVLTIIIQDNDVDLFTS